MGQRGGMREFRLTSGVEGGWGQTLISHHTKDTGQAVSPKKNIRVVPGKEELMLRGHQKQCPHRVVGGLSRAPDLWKDEIIISSDYVGVIPESWFLPPRLFFLHL